MHTHSLIPLSFLLHVYSVFAVQLSFEARSVKRTSHLQRRANIVGEPVANTHNAEYISNITLGGKTIPVMLDTGRCVLSFFCITRYLVSRRDSSDLWVTGSVPGSTDTGKSATLSYAVGQAAGSPNLYVRSSYIRLMSHLR
jgi:hypothetical protein